jgi:hypothetical protein
MPKNPIVVIRNEDIVYKRQCFFFQKSGSKAAIVKTVGLAKPPIATHQQANTGKSIPILQNGVQNFPGSWGKER